MADQAAIQQFKAVTGASEETAKFYLESAGGNLDVAVLSYMEGGGAAHDSRELDEDTLPDAPVSAPAVQPPQQPRLQANPAASGGPSGAKPAAAQRSSRQARGNVRSLADLGASDEDEDSDEANEYYAGGEKSGQVVRGAPRDDEGGDDSSDRVEGLFSRARQSGARQGTPADRPGAPGHAGGLSAFAGTARTLAGGEAVPEPPASTSPPPPQQHEIIFWRNNVFTVDGGEPRSITSPENREFLEAVVKGECPRELEVQSNGAHIDVSLVRRNEDYTPPVQPRHVAFSGAARTLAGPSDSSTAQGSASAPTSAAGPSTTTTTWEGVDDSQPSTSIQIRLSDGSRMGAQFNLTHTIADIRRFISASRPGMQASFRLGTVFPPAALDDDSATIQQAGLANAVVVQKP